MSVTYRIVKRCVYGNAEDKELGRGTVESLSDVRNNVPTIIVKRPAAPRMIPKIYVYEIQVLAVNAFGVECWSYYLPVIPYIEVPTTVSMSACLTSADVPLVQEEFVPRAFTARDIPLSGADLTLPSFITPAVTHI